MAGKVRRLASAWAAFAVCAGGGLRAQTNSEGPSLEALRAQVAALQQVMEAQQATINELRAALGRLETRETPMPPPPSPGGGAPNPTAPVASPTMATDRDWDLDWYGYVKVDASYDTQKGVNGDLYKYALPEKGGTQDNEFSLTAKQTRFGVKVNGPEWEGARLTGRVEMDFYGSLSDDAPNPRLRLGYLNAAYEDWNLLVGQDWDTVIIFQPTTVNFATFASQGAIWSRRPQVRLSRRFEVGPGVLTAKVAAARTVGTDLDTSGQEDGKDSGHPTLQWATEWRMPVEEKGDLIFGLSGLWGEETLDLTGVDSRRFSSRLLQFTAVAPVTRRIQVAGAIWAGANLSKYNGGIDQGINLALDREVESVGGWAQVQLKLTPRVTAYVGAGVDDPRDHDLVPGMRSRNRQVTITANWQVVKNFTWSIEYLRMETSYLLVDGSEDEALNNRWQTAATLSF